MKQYITEEQFKSLSTDATIKLLKWSEGCRSFQNMINEGGYDPNIVVFSIGELIEFLEDHQSRSTRTKAFGGAGNILNDLIKPDNPQDGLYLDTNTLCDDLWRAVVEVLESKL